MSPDQVARTLSRCPYVFFRYSNAKWGDIPLLIFLNFEKGKVSLLCIWHGRASTECSSYLVLTKVLCIISNHFLALFSSLTNFTNHALFLTGCFYSNVIKYRPFSHLIRAKLVEPSLCLGSGLLDICLANVNYVNVRVIKFFRFSAFIGSQMPCFVLALIKGSQLTTILMYLISSI